MYRLLAPYSLGPNCYGQEYCTTISKLQTVTRSQSECVDEAALWHPSQYDIKRKGSRPHFSRITSENVKENIKRTIKFLHLNSLWVICCWYDIERFINQSSVVFWLLSLACFLTPLSPLCSVQTFPPQSSICIYVTSKNNFSELHASVLFPLRVIVTKNLIQRT